MVEISVVREMQSLLGEAPMWHGAERALYWIDALKFYDPSPREADDETVGAGPDRE